jgi:hypothetical protein
MKTKKSAKKGKVKVGKLKVEKEKIADLTDKDAKRVRGGQADGPPKRCSIYVT